MQALPHPKGLWQQAASDKKSLTRPLEKMRRHVIFASSGREAPPGGCKRGDRA
jgi:hypothetical protein